MLHEFKEYRPYRNIVQFRREIGNTSATRRLHAVNATSSLIDRSLTPRAPDFRSAGR